MKKRKLFLVWLFMAILGTLPTMAVEYYVSDITLKQGEQMRISLPSMYEEAMNSYGSGYPYTWSSDNKSVCTATTYNSRTWCNIYANGVGTTKIHYKGQYYRNGVIYDYNCYWDITVTSNGGGGSGGDIPTGDPNEPNENWLTVGNYSTSWYNSNQSEFTISNNRELAGLAYLVNNGYSNFSGKTIKISDDINLSGKTWTAIGPTGSEQYFKGTFDGQGHTIGGIYIGGGNNENQKYFGFFGRLEYAKVCNVTLQGEVRVINPVVPSSSTYNINHYVGGLAGNAYQSTIENCKCEMPVEYSRNVLAGGKEVQNIYVGGMFGWKSSSTVRYCSHEGDVKCTQTPSSAGYNAVASPYVGGLMGYNGGTIEYSENISSTISCEVPTNSKSSNHVRVGGLFGEGYGTVEHCRNISSFDIKHHGFAYTSAIINVYVGGIGGKSTATTIDCYTSISKAVITTPTTSNFQVYYSGIGGSTSTSKANFSNSDVSIQASKTYTREYDGSTSFTSALMQTSAFLEELNLYSNGTVWGQNDGGYPYLIKLQGSTAPTNISVSPASKTIKVGETFTPTYTLTPSNATTTVKWSSDDSSIASVNQSTGKVTGVKAGTTYVRATTSNGKTDWCKVTVEEATVEPTSISVSPSSRTILVGGTFTPTYTISPSNATTTVKWSSDDSSIASVNQSTGLVTGIKVGTTYIYATTSNGKIDYCKVTVENGIAVDATNFPDEEFRNWLLRQNYGEDGVLTETEIEGVTSIRVNSLRASSLKGIEHFTALTHLDCSYNKLSVLDVSKNTALTHLICAYNQLTTLDVSKNTELTILECGENPLAKLDISENTELKYLYCYSNQLTALDVSKNIALVDLECDDNQLTMLDVSKNAELTTLRCDRNQLTALDVSKNIALVDLDCTHNQLTMLDVSKNTMLTNLGCGNNQLSALDVSKNTALTYLECGSNLLSALDMSKNTMLTELYCDENQLEVLDVSKNTALTYLRCYANQLTALDVSSCVALTYLECEDNQLSILNVSKNIALISLDCNDNHLSNLDVSSCVVLEWLTCFNNQIKGISMDAFIRSLPQNTTNRTYYLEIYDYTENEGNVCTKKQVAAIKAKGWTPTCYTGTGWEDYEGSDEIKGTEETPFTPAEANEYGSTLSANEQSQENYYIRGMVVSIKEQFSTQYGNATFYISADGTEKDQFYIYRALYLGNTKYAGQDLQLRVGDDVVVCGKITNYMGTLPETVQNQAYVVSINGITAGIRDITTGGNADAPVYTLSGQKVTNVKKGIYIKNGKKVIVK